MNVEFKNNKVYRLLLGSGSKHIFSSVGYGIDSE